MKADRPIKISLVLAVLQLVLVLSQLPFSTAAEFTVNSSFDRSDLEPGNGLCVAYLTVLPPFVLPFCTLRAAIEETNALPGPDIINIPAGNYLLDTPGINEENAATGDLDITDSLRIRGKGVVMSLIDGNRLDRVFDIPNPNTQVTIEQLTITNGSLPPLLAGVHQGGGGIRNQGSLTLRNVMLEGNRVNGSSSGDAGGAIRNMSTCILVNSTARNNIAATGGGISNGPQGTLSIVASTINRNASFSGGGLNNEGKAKILNATISGNLIRSGAYPYGGGIYNTADLEILQSTITGNKAPGLGGGLNNEGRVRMINTIIAGNANTNCLLIRPIDSLGSNLDDDNSCGLDAVTDINNADPRLDPLQDHGGQTLTHGLLIGSPAVDSGQDLASIGITTDQRGVNRPDGSAFDIGAFETRKRSVVPFITPLLCCKK